MFYCLKHEETYLSKDTINEFPSVFLHVNECHMNMYVSREAMKLHFEAEDNRGNGTLFVYCTSIGLVL